MTTPELLPCPFCGGKAHSTLREDYSGSPFAVAECIDCIAEIAIAYSSMEDGQDDLRQAIAAWNTRAPLSPAVLAELPEVRADAVSLNAAEERADTYKAALELITTLGNATAQRIARAAIAAAIREGRE